MATKICRVCNQEKEYSKFHLHKECVGGVIGTCRDCTNKSKEGWLEKTRLTRVAKQTKKNRDNKAYWVQEKGGKCADCQERYPQCVYQFHHVDGTKEANPSTVMNWEFNRAKQEMDKCVLLCANCHMIRHYGSGE